MENTTERTTWTKDAPTTPGYYWAVRMWPSRELAAEPVQVCIAVDYTRDEEDCEVLIARGSAGTLPPLQYPAMLWSKEPIEVPSFPDDLEETGEQMVRRLNAKIADDSQWPEEGPASKYSMGQRVTFRDQMGTVLKVTLQEIDVLLDDGSNVTFALPW